MGTIARPNSPLTASDGYAEVEANESTITTLVNGNLNHENLASEGIRNTNIDKDEVFTTETWDNILQGGHFPLWSLGTSDVPDSWTAELTPTIDQDDAPTYAPSTHYSCKITGAGAALEGIYQTIALRKNATYTVTFKVKATAGDTAVVKIVDGDSAEKASEEYTDTDWQTDDNKKYFTFTTGTTTNAGAITIKLLAKADTDIVWFAEVQITEGEMAKGYQYLSTNADQVDGFHADDTAADAKLLTYSGIPRMLVSESDQMTEISGDHNAYTTKATYKVYLPAKTTKVRCYVRAHYDAPETVGTIRFLFGSTDSVDVTGYPATNYGWVSNTGTLTVNSAAGGWFDLEIQMYNASNYTQYIKGLAVAFEDF
jgi:hypothetical protein